MKILIAVSSAVFLTACAGGNYVDPLSNIRNQAFATTQGYAQSVSAFLATNSQDQALEKAKTNIAASLKDPESAQFRNVRILNYSDGKVICGEVNGKNSYGGYVGFVPFVAGIDSSTLYDKDDKYPAIQSAANSGITSACN